MAGRACESGYHRARWSKVQGVDIVLGFQEGVVGSEVADIARRCVRRNRNAVLAIFDLAYGVRHPSCRAVGEIAVLDYLRTLWNRWFTDGSTRDSGSRCSCREQRKSDSEHVQKPKQ